jgi:hypothetical protein
MDGLWYDTISRNLSVGVGSFWRPIFTPTLSVPFYADHPPLVFAIESAFFRVLGDHWWVGKFYGFVTLVVAARLLQALWRAAGGAARDGWLPLLFWLSAPLVTWSFSNEMLENTMLLFQLGAAWAFVHASAHRGTRSDLLCVLAGALLFGGLMCKGAVAPFPLVLPVVLALLPGGGLRAQRWCRRSSRSRRRACCSGSCSRCRTRGPTGIATRRPTSCPPVGTARRRGQSPAHRRQAVPRARADARVDRVGRLGRLAGRAHG